MSIPCPPHHEQALSISMVIYYELGTGVMALSQKVVAYKCKYWLLTYRKEAAPGLNSLHTQWNNGLLFYILDCSWCRWLGKLLNVNTQANSSASSLLSILQHQADSWVGVIPWILYIRKQLYKSRLRDITWSVS